MPEICLQLTTLNAAVKAAGLEATLASPGNIRTQFTIIVSFFLSFLISIATFVAIIIVFKTSDGIENSGGMTHHPF